MKITYEFKCSQSDEGMKLLKVFEMTGLKEHLLLAVELTPNEVEDLQSVLKEAAK